MVHYRGIDGGGVGVGGSLQALFITMFTIGGVGWWELGGGLVGVVLHTCVMDSLWDDFSIAGGGVTAYNHTQLPMAQWEPQDVGGWGRGLTLQKPEVIYSDIH